MRIWKLDEMAISWKDWKLRQESIHKLWGCWRSGSYEVGDVKHSSAMIRSSSWPQTEWGYFKPLCTQLATTWVLSKAKIVLRPLASGLLSPPVRWWERWVFQDISWRYFKKSWKMKFEKRLVWCEMLKCTNIYGKRVLRKRWELRCQ